MSDPKPELLTYDQFMDRTEVSHRTSVVNTTIRTLLQRILEIDDALLEKNALEQYALVLKLKTDVLNSPFLSGLYVRNADSAGLIPNTTTAECLSHACKWVGALQDCVSNVPGAQAKCPVCGNSEVFVKNHQKC